MKTVVETRVTTVNVVVDIQTSQLDEVFSYAAYAPAPPIGGRVRVPFGGRSVNGWIVSATVPPEAVHDLRFVEEVLDDPPLSENAIALAQWMRRRYACTFREALLTVAPRSAEASERYRFVHDPPALDESAQLLHGRFAGKEGFTPLAARRALNTPLQKVPLTIVRQTLVRLARAGVLEKVAPMRESAQNRLANDSLIMLVDATQAKSSAQKQVVAALDEAGGSLLFADLKRRLAAGAALINRTHKAGAIRIEYHAARAPRLPSAAPRAALVPTTQQREAIERIDAAVQAGTTVALLHGVTGSGKTFVYSRLVDRVRSRGGQAVVLVPEIALTPQTAGRFVAAFGAGVAVLHSGLSAKEKASVWQSAASGALDVIVGARSAVFAPLPNLQLIVVDEEHEASYKQDVAPRYDAAAVAIERMLHTGGGVLLGSATPSLETYWRARHGEMLYVRLTERATSAPLPAVDVIDMTEQRGAQGRRPLSAVLTAAMETTLSRGEKIMLFVNRRGYAGLLLCRACGFAPRCKRCAVTLVVHSADQSLRCHVCGDAFRIPARCPKCSSLDLRPFGFGTQRVEEEVRALFPGARIVRMDSDSTGAQGAHERLLTEFAEQGDILIGTQMIAKGLDFPTVTLVGVVAADLDLNRPDFRAAERTFGLLTQVAGRAGRVAPGSRVLVQTYAPEHYAIALAAQHDYDAFAQQELLLRKELRYPPFGRLAYVVVVGAGVQEVELQARALAQELRNATHGVLVLGPAPDPLAKARGEYRYRIALKSDSLEDLLDACERIQSRRLGNDIRQVAIVDPR